MHIKAEWPPTSHGKTYIDLPADRQFDAIAFDNLKLLYCTDSQTETTHLLRMQETFESELQYMQVDPSFQPKAAMHVVLVADAKKSNAQMRVSMHADIGQHAKMQET